MPNCQRRLRLRFIKSSMRENKNSWLPVGTNLTTGLREAIWQRFESYFVAL